MTELRRPPRRTFPEPELEGEQEVDLRGVWRMIASRWWLPVAGLVLGLFVGYLLTLGNGSVYRAKAVVYLGVAFTPSGNNLIPQSLATNPRTVDSIVHSEYALRRAARESGMDLGQLRAGVTSKALAAIRVRSSQNPLVEISVTGSGPGKVARAAASLSKQVLAAVSGYVEQKIKRLNETIRISKSRLVYLNNRLARYRKLQDQVIKRRDLNFTQKLLLITNFNSVINVTEGRIPGIEANLLNIQPLLALAQRIELPRIETPPVAVKTTARSPRNSALVGGALGLLLGTIAALLWEALRLRRAGSARPAI